LNVKVLGACVGLFAGRAGATPRGDFIRTGHVNGLLACYRMTSDDVMQETLRLLEAKR